METTWTLITPDGATIYGRKNAGRMPSRAAVFIVHGLNCSMYDYPYKRAADALSRDYDVYRFNLYDGQDGGRRLLDCTLQTHADDLNTVLRHFAPDYDCVFLIGHSYGGLTIMLAAPENITAASLWDPSFDMKQVDVDFARCYEEIGSGYYALHWGSTLLLPHAMVAERQHFDRQKCIQMAKDFGAPVQVVFAQNGYYITKDVSYHSFGHPQNRKDIVRGTTHCFYEGNSCNTLLRKTKAWFQSFL